jgi:hypothetical protein
MEAHKEEKALLVWEARQTIAGKMLDNVEEVFEKKGLSGSRRAKLAMAEKGKEIIEQYRKDVPVLVKQYLDNEEFMGLVKNGISVLEKGGMSGRPDMLDVINGGRGYALIIMAKTAAKRIERNGSFTDEEKRLAKVAAEEVSIVMTRKALKGAIRDLKISNALLPALRRGKMRQEQNEIKQALEEIDKN